MFLPGCSKPGGMAMVTRSGVSGSLFLDVPVYVVDLAGHLRWHWCEISPFLTLAENLSSLFSFDDLHHVEYEEPWAAGLLRQLDRSLKNAPFRIGWI